MRLLTKPPKEMDNSICGVIHQRPTPTQPTIKLSPSLIGGLDGTMLQSKVGSCKLRSVPSAAVAHTFSLKWLRMACDYDAVPWHAIIIYSTDPTHQFIPPISKSNSSKAIASTAIANLTNFHH